MFLKRYKYNLNNFKSYVLLDVRVAFWATAAPAKQTKASNLDMVCNRTKIILEKCLWLFHFSGKKYITRKYWGRLIFYSRVSGRRGGRECGRLVPPHFISAADPRLAVRKLSVLLAGLTERNQRSRPYCQPASLPVRTSVRKKPTSLIIVSVLFQTSEAL